MEKENGVPAVAVAQLCKSVPDAEGEWQILRGITFSVPARQSVAIVGAAGSGKSTLLSIMAGLDAPTCGTVRLAGQDIFALDEDARAALRIGFVFQNFQLLPRLTALENVMLPLELAGRRDAKEAARHMLSRVGLAGRMRHYPRLLSGGEQQRVALARAFVVQPALLLADEPTGSLDAASSARVMELMHALNREQGATLILVTHDAGIAARCQRRISVQAGSVVADSGAEERVLHTEIGD